jgi:hypothetical protein
MAERRDLDWLLAPRRVFVLLAAMLAITLFVAPWPTREDSGGALTSFVASPAGARGFYEILDRLGHTVERRLTPMRDTLDTRALYVILEPSIPLTASEVHRLLETVRAGARLLTVPALGSRLADSLGVRRVPVLPEGTAGDGGRFGRRDSSAAFGPGWVRWVLRAPGPQDDDIAATFVPAADATTILWLNTRRGQEPMVVGLPYGRGRVLVAAEPGLFRNSTLRQEGGAVRAVRIVEWLTDGEGGPLVFDEYHHGYGAHASVLREARRALTDTTAGRLVLQIAVAGLVLLLAVGVRVYASSGGRRSNTWVRWPAPTRPCALHPALRVCSCGGCSAAIVDHGTAATSFRTCARSGERIRRFRRTSNESARRLRTRNRFRPRR